MKITRACDYAIRALVELSNARDGVISLRSDLAKITNVPNSFLGKILQSLARAEILVSGRGKKGGFRLARPASQITIYDVVIAVEGKLVVADCLVDTGACPDVDVCKIRSVWNNMQATVTQKMKEVSIEDLK
ncbi:MAG: Rrf2 family transcriptional regulator [Deferribacteraceae bacterium]|jgi:Rrf2 family protein|nr:Rrf2 family transcriptional regulator [Deferribacteraceae bacterium]